MSEKPFQPIFDYKVIYMFTLNDEEHEGFIKIGDATVRTDLPIDNLFPNCRVLNQAALERIRSYTNTAGFTPRLLHTELAIRTEPGDPPKLVPFRDYEVHAVLKNSGIKNKKVGNSTGQEWFYIDLETAKKAVAAVKKNMANLSGVKTKKFTPIIFRPEQERAVSATVKRFKKADRMLWNAKMRFGKTLCALQVIKECQFKKTIIITHKPAVNDGWYEDFNKIFYDEDWVYGSKFNGYTAKDLLKQKKNFVYFASIQDLRGSKFIGGKFNKDREIFETVWDCVIVDEAHEGTKTALGDEVVTNLVKESLGKTKFLALSGTPFNIVTDFEEESIYTWDYIMEQECKSEWDKQHFGDSNPYAELPELKIFTYDLGNVLSNKNYIAVDDKAFNFREFFRTWTGDAGQDYDNMPESANIGDFVHESDIKSFLDLLTKEDADSCYPFSNEEYRNLFHHTLWMLPGVREARALSKLLQAHPVFGMFNIVNVAGDGDEEDPPEQALSKVKNAIEDAGIDGYTITLSCGKLTTGVTVREWTGVFMLSGSYSTSAMNYLQTIFRVQSPCRFDGKIKDAGYVFDFAPDRTLKMVADSVSVSAKAGQTTDDDKEILGKFLNFCPVISVLGSHMEPYDTPRLLQQLKRAYADKVVRHGFDDVKLYNNNLLKLDQLDIKKFKKLKKIIGKSKPQANLTKIDLNNQGLTKKDRAVLEKKRKKQKLSPEEQKRWNEIKKAKQLRANAIKILRGISIRMPLLIYGADVPYTEDINLESFIDKVDDASWKEFMPKGVTKEIFRGFLQYYDEEIFISAGRHIRNIAKSADTLEPTERVKKIASLFRYFKNPDKETVLTPWSVVNMHMSDCLGGWNFWDEDYSAELDRPRFVRKKDVTDNVFCKDDVRILEINSKTGLYPLYVSYSAYRHKCNKTGIQLEKMDVHERRKLWRETIRDNIYVICNTPMAKAITQRTLLGYIENQTINAHYFDNLVNAMEHKADSFVNRVLRKSYWKKGDGTMKIDAVVGNPPYMETDKGASASARPIYQYFVEAAKKLRPNYVSFITPTRWYAGGKGLDDFRDDMLNDPHIATLHDYLHPEIIFPNTNIRGGVCYFLWDRSYDNTKNLVNVVSHDESGIVDNIMRPMRTNNADIFIRSSAAIEILLKVQRCGYDSLADIISPRRPFGLGGQVYKSEKFKDESKGLEKPVGCYVKGMALGYIERDLVPAHKKWIDSWKVFMPRANNIGTELPDDNLNTFVGKPGEICSESYIAIGCEYNLNEKSATNLANYLRTKFARFMHSIAKASQDATAKTFIYVPVQDFSRAWTDSDLYELYKLTDEEIAYIEKNIAEM